MAKKKLNKKVAIIGSIVLVVFLLAVVVVVLRFGKDPSKFLADAETALAQNDYQSAERNYRQAYGCAKDDELKIDILFKLADFYLVNNEFHEPNWIKAISCWNTVINIDPKHVPARMALLKYFYEIGDSGNPGAWNTVQSTASELAQIIEEKQMESDVYVLLAKARAMLEIAALGQTADREKALQEAVVELERLKEMAPDNIIDIYSYLARAQVVAGEIENSKGVLGAMERADTKAEEILREAVEVAPDNPKAHVNLLDTKLKTAYEKIGGVGWRDDEAVQALEHDYTLLIERYPSCPEAYMALSRFYQVDIRNLNKAVEAVEKAIELDSENVDYATAMANLYYRKSSIYKDKESLFRAIEIAKNTLDLPDAQDVPGPRRFAHIRNRHVLFALLSTWYIEQALEAAEAGDEEQRQQWIAKAEETIHEIKQLIGTGDNIYVIKWDGMLTMAKGDRTTAIRKMFSAYEQLKASGDTDASLSYMLAEAFKGEPEIGARQEFLESAILNKPSIALQKPEALLDYAELMLQRRAWSPVLAVVEAYEKSRLVTERSQRIRVEAYIGAGQLDDAEKQLSQMTPDTPDTIELKLTLTRRRIAGITATQQKQQKDQTELYKQTELQKYRDKLKQLRQEMLKLEPERLEVVFVTCNDYLMDGQVDRAKSLIDKFLAHSPDNLTAQVYRRRLDEPDPVVVPKERLTQILEDVITNVPDELKRAIALGQHYQSRGLIEKAMAEFKKACEMAPDNSSAIGGLFDTALMNKNIALAEQMVEKVRRNNLDECEGNFFDARLDMAKEDWQSAIGKLDDCLKDKPVFPMGYLLRSQTNEALGNHDNAVKDAMTAAKMEPMNATIAKQVVTVLYNRDMRLGSQLSSEQFDETKQALANAIFLNPDDWNLYSIYAEYISEREPEDALATRQRLLTRFPNLENSLMLGNMATRMAIKDTDKKRRDALFEIAEDAYRRAYDIEPENKNVLDAYSELLRLTGRGEKAIDLLTEQDTSLWQFYLRDGQYDKARSILETLYKSNPKDVAVVRGLAITASKSEDKEGYKRYSEELLSLERTTDNELMQIRGYLEVGLLKEAELKLASFRERNPQEPEGMLLEAWSAMTNGQLEKARQLLNQTLELDSENAAAWRLRGGVNRLLGNFNQAMEDFQKSKNIKANSTIRIALARVYSQVGRMAAAIGELKEALKDEQAPRLVRTMLEQFYRQTGRKVDLKHFYDEILQKYPEGGYWNFRAGQFALREKDYEQAEKLLLKAWEISQEQEKGNMQSLDQYLEALWQQEKYKELLEYGAKYIDTIYAPIVYAQMAQTRFKMGSKAIAVDYYRKAIEKCGTNDKLIMGVLKNMSNTVGRGEVVRWCSEKLRANPNSPAANMTMFRLAQQSGDYNRALMHIDKFVSLLNPDSPVWVERMIDKANTLIMAYVKTSDKQYLATAISEFENILEKQPQNVSVLNNLAYLLADNDEQLDKAVEHAKRAYEASPNEADTVDTYAYTLCKVGEYEKAEELLLMAVQIFERESVTVPWDVYKHLGMVYEGLGEMTKANEAYTRALEIAERRASEKNKNELVEAIRRVSQ
jgi:tetratricopeptide (TPR) repeat protein